MKRAKAMKYASIAFVLGFLALGLASRPALAATQTASFSVTVTVVSSCRASAPATAFGTYTAAGVNATSPASVACTSPTPYNVSLSAELVPSAIATTQKTTVSASDSLNHALLLDSAHTVNSGRTAGADTVAGTGSGSFKPNAFYRQAAGAQLVASGAFADSVMVTVTY
jgi:spore coat protein U-like protein